MSTGAQHTETKGLSAALRRFPAHASEVEHLVATDENFRSLCDDLAAAEAALLGFPELPVAIKAERRIECESWIESLSAEIENALRESKVIVLGSKRTARQKDTHR
jgi:hypothetical protein